MFRLKALPLIAAFIIFSASSYGKSVTREETLLVDLSSSRTIDSVKGQKIGLPANISPGAHTHPCPVIGYILEGTVIYQIEGQPAKTLNAGDSFYEPENTVVLRFDTQNEPVKFLAYYLTKEGDEPLVKMIK